MTAKTGKTDRTFLGHSVVDRMVIYSSVSQIVLFDPAWSGCHARWAYQYLPQVDVPPPYSKRPAKTKRQVAGSQHARDLEHYLKTGEDVLSPTLQEAKRFLPSPRNPLTGALDILTEHPLGPDVRRAVALRRDWLTRSPGCGIEPEGDAVAAEVRRCAGLTASGVPIDGAWDYGHFRGEYVDEDGALRPEVRPDKTFEVVDLKTTSRVNPQTVGSGKNRGVVLPGYAKTRAEILDHPQNLGYGVAIAGGNPGMRYGRLGNVYAQTTRRYAEKRTGILHVDEIRERWRRRGDAVMVEMEQVAAVDRIDQVEGSWASCDAFTHVDPKDPEATLPGCGHRYYCPHFARRPIRVFTQGETYVTQGRSLFDALAPDAAPSPSPIPTGLPTGPPEDREAALARERDTLLAQERAAVPPAPPTGGGNGVLPPDAPRHASLLDAAAPVPASAVAEIADPDLRARVEEHNRLHAERAAAEAALAPKRAGGRCAGSGLVVQFSVAEAMRKRFACPICGAERPIPREAREAGATSVAFPGHNVPRAERGSEVQALDPPSRDGPREGTVVDDRDVGVDDSVTLSAAEVEILAALFRDRALALAAAVSEEALEILRRLRMV